MSATNTHTGHVLACVPRHDGQVMIRVKPDRGPEIIAVHPHQLPEGKRVTVSGYPPRLVG